MMRWPIGAGDVADCLRFQAAAGSAVAPQDRRTIGGPVVDVSHRAAVGKLERAVGHSHWLADPPRSVTAMKPDVNIPDEPAPSELVIEDIEVGDGDEATAG